MAASSSFQPPDCYSYYSYCFRSKTMGFLILGLFVHGIIFSKLFTWLAIELDYNHHHHQHQHHASYASSSSTATAATTTTTTRRINKSNTGQQPTQQVLQVVPPPLHYYYSQEKNNKKESPKSASSFTRFSVDLGKTFFGQGEEAASSNANDNNNKIREDLRIRNKERLRVAAAKKKEQENFEALLNKTGKREFMSSPDQQQQQQQQSRYNLTSSSSNSSELLLPPPPKDHISLWKLRQQLGIEVPPEEWDDIPDWSNISNIFGKEPIVLGLETCEAYRNSVPPNKRSVAPAGNFNTGTNLFSVFFGRNCQFGGRGGGGGDDDDDKKQLPPLLQVPWGKHNLGYARIDNYKINKTRYQAFDNNNILPVVLVRHPVSWMFSTCLHSYAAHWNHTQTNCPHLVKDEFFVNAHHAQQQQQQQEQQQQYAEYASSTTNNNNNNNNNKPYHYTSKDLYPVHVAYGYRRDPNKKFYRHRSLIHFWKEWIESHLIDFPYPRLIVRLEDIIYHPLEVLTKICKCAGGKQRPGNRISMPQESVKVRRDRMRNKTGLPGSLVRGNASDTAGLLKAWKDHATIPEKWARMSIKDQQAVQQVLMMNDNNNKKRKKRRRQQQQQHDNDHYDDADAEDHDDLLDLLHYKI